MNEMEMFRETLLNREAMYIFADGLARSVAGDVPNPTGHDNFNDVLAEIIGTVQRQSIDVVFGHAESEIEVMFLNTLVTCFASMSPGRLILQSPSEDAPKDIQGMRDNFQEAKEIMDMYMSAVMEVKGVDRQAAFAEFMDYAEEGVRIGEVDEGFPSTCLAVEHFDIRYSIFAFVQAAFPEIRVNGKSIRVDLLAFVPAYPSYRVAVEFDGFQFHNTKEAFVNDRKRDRLLRSNGFDVLRYSGSEIYADPIQVAKDLANYLLERLPPSPNRSEMEKRVQSAMGGEGSSSSGNSGPR
jgi:hypothetical protein